MKNEEWTKQLRSDYCKKTGSVTKAQFPGQNAIGICGDKDRVVIQMTPEGLLANVATDAAAFEGWALVLQIWCDVAKIVLAWETPDHVSNESYQRFLYRVFRFRELFGKDWFEVSESVDETWIKSAKALGEGTLLLNVPGIKPITPERAATAKSERWYERALWESAAFRNHFNLSKVDRQWPVGLFKDKIAKANRIFEGGAAAIDLIGLANPTSPHSDPKLSLFELKTPENIMIGGFSELFFYTAVMRDAAGDVAPFKFCYRKPYGGRTDIAPDDINNCKQIESIMLLHHPLLADRHVLESINAAIDRRWNTEPDRASVHFRLVGYRYNDFSFEDR